MYAYRALLSRRKYQLGSYAIYTKGYVMVTKLTRLLGVMAMAGNYVKYFDYVFLSMRCLP